MMHFLNPLNPLKRNVIESVDLKLMINLPLWMYIVHLSEILEIFRVNLLMDVHILQSKSLDRITKYKK